MTDTDAILERVGVSGKWSFLHTEDGRCIVLPTEDMVRVLALAGATNSVIFWDRDAIGDVQPYLMPRPQVQVH